MFSTYWFTKELMPGPSQFSCSARDAVFHFCSNGWTQWVNCAFQRGEHFVAVLLIAVFFTRRSFFFIYLVFFLITKETRNNTSLVLITRAEATSHKIKMSDAISMREWKIQELYIFVAIYHCRRSSIFICIPIDVVQPNEQKQKEENRNSHLDKTKWQKKLNLWYLDRQLLIVWKTFFAILFYFIWFLLVLSPLNRTEIANWPL